MFVFALISVLGWILTNKTKKQSHKLKTFTVGSLCSVYPSSARRGLVIFHEHIADLLSGGVRLFFFFLV